MPRRPTVRLVLPVLTLALAAAGPAAAVDVGLEWDLEGLQIIAAGDLAPDPGLECIARSPYGEVGVYALGTGQLLDRLPSPFDNLETVHTLRDVDADGYAEIICVRPLDIGTVVGLLDLDRGVRRVWPDVSMPFQVQLFDLMNLNAAEPRALVLQGWAVVILSCADGSLLYDSTQDPDIGSGWYVGSLLLDDFDDDQRDELLLHMIQSGGPSWSFLVGDRDPVAGAGGPPAAGRVRLDQNWPNPLNGGTTIRYDLEQPGRVRLRVFDAAGRLVRTLADGHAPAGAHTRAWDGRDDGGRATASGIYFYELDVDGHRESRKLLQVR